MSLGSTRDDELSQLREDIHVLEKLSQSVRTIAAQIPAHSAANAILTWLWSSAWASRTVFVRAAR